MTDGEGEWRASYRRQGCLPIGVADVFMFLRGLEALLPPERLLRHLAALVPYESDGLTTFRARPAAVLLAESQEEVIQAVARAHRSSVRLRVAPSPATRAKAGAGRTCQSSRRFSSSSTRATSARRSSPGGCTVPRWVGATPAAMGRAGVVRGWARCPWRRGVWAPRRLVMRRCGRRRLKACRRSRKLVTEAQQWLECKTPEKEGQKSGGCLSC